MNPSTLVGVGASVLLMAVILVFGTDKPTQFIDLPSVAIVFGGTLAATFLSYPMRELRRLATLVRSVFHEDQLDTRHDIEELVGMAKLWMRGDLQAVERDFAFVVDARVEALTAVNAALGAEKALIESVRVFDQFTGEKAEAQMGAGKKSIALTVRLQPTAATLTEAEIEAVSAKIIEKVTKATGGTLRA